MSVTPGVGCAQALDVTKQNPKGDPAAVTLVRSFVKELIGTQRCLWHLDPARRIL